MTSFPVTLPDYGTSSIRLRQRSVVAVGESPTTLEQQVQRHQGQVWILEAEYPPKGRATAEPLISALCSLNGREGTFLFGDTANKTALGVATGTPLVKGAAQTGETLLTDGWTISTSGIVKAGMYIQLGSGSTARLHKIMADANSDGSGNASLVVWPRLSPVAVPVDNSAIVTASPVGVFRLLTDGTDWSVDSMHIYGIAISAASLP